MDVLVKYLYGNPHKFELFLSKSANVGVSKGTKAWLPDLRGLGLGVLPASFHRPPVDSAK